MSSFCWRRMVASKGCQHSSTLESDRSVGIASNVRLIGVLCCLLYSSKACIYSKHLSIYLSDRTLSGSGALCRRALWPSCCAICRYRLTNNSIDLWGSHRFAAPTAAAFLPNDMIALRWWMYGNRMMIATMTTTTKLAQGENEVLFTRTSKRRERPSAVVRLGERRRK